MRPLLGPQGPPEDHGLDDSAEVERPWSSVTRGGLSDAVHSGESPRPKAPLRVVIEYVVVDGKDGEALRRHQAAAIREVLEWAHAHRGRADTPRA